MATRAYQGEADIEAALRSILERMEKFVNSKKPRVPNPVDPEEDFADRWAMPKYKPLNLEQNFWNWLYQAQSDFNLISSYKNNVSFIIEQAHQKFSVRMNTSELSKRLGLAPSVKEITPKSHLIIKPAKPWSNG